MDFLRSRHAPLRITIFIVAAWGASCNLQAQTALQGAINGAKDAATAVANDPLTKKYANDAALAAANYTPAFGESLGTTITNKTLVPTSDVPAENAQADSSILPGGVVDRALK